MAFSIKKTRVRTNIIPPLEWQANFSHKENFHLYEIFPQKIDKNATSIVGSGCDCRDACLIQILFLRNFGCRFFFSDGATDSSYETACNGLSEEESQEKPDLRPVEEPQELASAFPPTFGHPSFTQTTVEESTNPPASHPTAKTTAKSPSRPSSPYGQGQDVHIDCVQRNSAPGAQGDAVVSTNNTHGAKEEYHEQHQDQQHTILSAHSHQKSQFLLTISAPSQSGRLCFLLLNQSSKSFLTQ